MDWPQLLIKLLLGLVIIVCVAVLAIRFIRSLGVRMPGWTSPSVVSVSTTSGVSAPPSTAPRATAGGLGRDRVTGRRVVSTLVLLAVAIVLVLVIMNVAWRVPNWAVSTGDSPSGNVAAVQPPPAKVSDDVRWTEPPADRAQVEAVVHTVKGVPLEPGRTRRIRLRDGYEALPSPSLESYPSVLNMYCSETRNGPKRLWTPERRCVGGWISFSVPDDPGSIPLDITYQLSWVGT